MLQIFSSDTKRNQCRISRHKRKKGENIMKKIKVTIITILSIFLMYSTCWAATYYINGTTGNDGNSGSSASPWKTIGKANSTLKAGDTVLVRKGTYRQTIRPNNSGTKGNYITYAGYENEEVIITGVDGGDLKNRSYVIIDKFKFLNVDYFVEMEPNGHHNIIQNCYMEEGTHSGGIRLNYGAHYNKILNNTLIGRCEPADLIQIRDSGHNLIEGNKLYYGTHNAITVQDRTIPKNNHFNIIRNNFIQNKWHSNISIYGIEYILFENNIVVDGGVDRKNNACGSDRDRNMAGPEHKGIMTNTKYSIFRNNILVNNGVGIALASNDTDWKGPCFNNRYYQNTINRNYEGFRVDGNPSATQNVLKNNIVFSNKNYEIRKYGSTELINEYVNNNVRGATVSYGSDDTVRNTISVDPLFIDENDRNFNLQLNSPMIDAGAFLTTTTNSGNGNIIQVEDARYFMDGWGIIEGDLIQLKGQTKTTRITSIDYKTNTLTVNTSLTWDKGQGVSLPYQGAAPDIGAFEFKGDCPGCKPPVNLRVVQ